MSDEKSKDVNQLRAESECIHELPFKQCALCASADWHVGVQNNNDELFAANLIKQEKRMQ